MARLKFSLEISHPSYDIDLKVYFRIDDSKQWDDPETGSSTVIDMQIRWVAKLGSELTRETPHHLSAISFRPDGEDGLNCILSVFFVGLRYIWHVRFFSSLISKVYGNIYQSSRFIWIANIPDLSKLKQKNLIY